MASSLPKLPRHVGRETDAEVGYALVCTATPGSDPHNDPVCGKPATHHIRWEEATTENGFACDAHLEFALGFNPFDVHSVENSACGMPGSFWILGQPSHCTMLALDEEPQRAGTTALTVGTQP
jgi:hypothetical protein